MVWPFFHNKHLSFTKVIDTPLESVLNVMHDPQVYMKLQPSIVEVTPNPTNHSEFISLEALKILGLLKINTESKVAVRIRDEGFIYFMISAAGTKAISITSARAVGNDRTEVTELFTVHVSARACFASVSFKLVASRAFSSLCQASSGMRK
jgi:hypothetical protein